MGASQERGDIGTGVGEAVSQGLEHEKYPLLIGVKLPRSESDWNRANDYFCIQIDTSRDLGDLNAEISYMNEVVCSYFQDACDLVKEVSKFNHYNSMSKSKLKKCLRELKFCNGNLEEIKYISRLLHKSINWFQFADDTALISAHGEDNQLLTNVVSKWCTWADLSIRVEKFHTFGMKKYMSKVVQYEPVITLLGK